MMREKLKIVLSRAVTLVLNDLGPMDPCIMSAQTAYFIIMSRFGIFMKDTNQAALLMVIPALLFGRRL